MRSKALASWGTPVSSVLKPRRHTSQSNPGLKRWIHTYIQSLFPFDTKPIETKSNLVLVQFHQVIPLLQICLVLSELVIRGKLLQAWLGIATAVSLQTLQHIHRLWRLRFQCKLSLFALADLCNWRRITLILSEHIHCSEHLQRNRKRAASHAKKEAAPKNRHCHWFMPSPIALCCHDKSCQIVRIDAMLNTKMHHERLIVFSHTANWISLMSQAVSLLPCLPLTSSRYWIFPLLSCKITLYKTRTFCPGNSSSKVLYQI